MSTRRPRLTDAQEQRIRALCEQGHTIPCIAEQLGFSYKQVHRALLRQELKPTPAPHLGRPSRAAPKPEAVRGARPRPTKVVVSADQQQFITRWQQSGISSRELARHLEVDWRVLSIELRARKQITPLRLARLQQLLTDLSA